MKKSKRMALKITSLQQGAVDELIAFYRLTKHPMNEADIFDIYKCIIQKRSVAKSKYN
jgi:hypothetical protein